MRYHSTVQGSIPCCAEAILFKKIKERKNGLGNISFGILFWIHYSLGNLFPCIHFRTQGRDEKRKKEQQMSEFKEGFQAYLLNKPFLIYKFKIGE